MKNLIPYKFYEKFTFNKSYNTFITEASKINSLINKLGLNEENAKFLDEKCGPLSILFGNKIIDYLIEEWERNFSIKTNRKDFIRKINETSFKDRFGYSVTYIMDWIKVGLSGLLGSNKELGLEELYQKAKEWHENLQIGEGEYNYIENHKILIDYRDEDGIGFYWTDLETNYDDAEAKRMGHCASTDKKNTLISLRKNIRLNDKYTLNKSILTASVGKEDGRLCQLKDAGNIKPSDVYHKYIVDLLSIGIVKKIGNDDEYRISNDFSLKDLDEKNIKILYKNNPELFNNYAGQLLLANYDIISIYTLDSSFECVIKSEHLKKYIDGGYPTNVSKERKLGAIIKYDIFELILSNFYFNDYYYDHDVESAISYLNEENKEKIWLLIRKEAYKEDTDIQNLNLEEALDELKSKYLLDMIMEFYHNQKINITQTYRLNELKKCLEFYGVVKKMEDDEVIIVINFDDFTSNISLKDYHDAVYNTETLQQALEELLKKGLINKPIFKINKNYETEINTTLFNYLINNEIKKNL